MKRALLWAFVFVMTVVPAVSGVCGLGCDVDARADAVRDAEVIKSAGTGTTPECPLHARRTPDRSAPAAPASTPGHCRHDHTTARNGIVRSSADLSRPISPVLALAARPPAAIAGARLSRLFPRVFSGPPPSSSTRPLVLRI
jgi:hypothetical protein